MKKMILIECCLEMFILKIQKIEMSKIIHYFLSLLFYHRTIDLLLLLYWLVMDMNQLFDTLISFYQCFKSTKKMNSEYLIFFFKIIFNRIKCTFFIIGIILLFLFAFLSWEKFFLKIIKLYFEENFSLWIQIDLNRIHLT